MVCMFSSVSRVLTRARSHAHARPHGAPRVRRVIASALALAAFALPSGSAAATPKDSTAQLASIHRLTPSEFAAIERVYVAALPLDDFRTSKTPPQSKLDAAGRAVVRACRKLSTRDPLLRALRAGCPATIEFTEATKALDACSDATCLKRALTSARGTLRRAVSGSHATDRAINATHLARRCKRALVTPPEGYTAYKQLDTGLGKLRHALDTGSSDDLAAAEAALARAEKAANRLPTSRRSLQLLRSDCR
jgi:hypothetical protein